MRLYISGPIKGVDNARANFASAATDLRLSGHEPVNPFDVKALCLGTCNGLDDVRHYDCFMRGDIAALMGCEGVALIAGWEQSRGARLEHAVALQVGLPVAELDDYFDYEPCRSEERAPLHLDGYWMRCSRVGPHTEHENSDTGITWTHA